jgi:hypothetical protein
MYRNRSVGRPQARWSDDLRRTACRSWMRVAEDRARWRDIGEAYVQQWTVVGCGRKKMAFCLKKFSDHGTS